MNKLVLKKFLISVLFTFSIALSGFGCSGGLGVKVQLENTHPNYSVDSTLTFVWKQKHRFPVKRFHPINREIALLETHRGELFYINLNNGEQLSGTWKPLKGRIDDLTIDYEKQILYLFSVEKEKIIAHDLSVDKTIWKKNRVEEKGEHFFSQTPLFNQEYLDSLELDSPVYSNPILINNTLYVGDAKGTVQAFKDGSLLWKYDSHELISHPLMATRSQLWVPLAKGYIVVLDIQTGEEVVKQKLNHPYEAGFLSNHGVVIADRKRNVYLVNTAE